MKYVITKRTVLESKVLELHDDHFIFSASRAAGSAHTFSYDQVRAILLAEGSDAICFYMDTNSYSIGFDLSQPAELEALEFFINQSRASQGLPPLSLSD